MGRAERGPVPLWDADLAVKELRRNAARGVRAVAFSELPAYLDLPSLHSRYWDPFFAACEETGTVLAMHIGSSTRTPQTSADAPGAVGGKDAVGVSLLEQVGLANVTFETDYPHQDGTWPRSREEAALQFGHLGQDAINQIARGNAIKLLGLDLPEHLNSRSFNNERGRAACLAPLLLISRDFISSADSGALGSGQASSAIPS